MIIAWRLKVRASKCQQCLISAIHESCENDAPPVLLRESSSLGSARSIALVSLRCFVRVLFVSSHCSHSAPTLEGSHLDQSYLWMNCIPW